MSVSRKGGRGWNKSIESKVVDAALRGDGQALDFSWRSVRGSNRSARACAEIAINNLYKSGQELPLPTIDGALRPLVVAIPVAE
jgi:hypothetical protein